MTVAADADESVTVSLSAPDSTERVRRSSPTERELCVTDAYSGAVESGALSETVTLSSAPSASSAGVTVTDCATFQLVASNVSAVEGTVAAPGSSLLKLTFTSPDFGGTASATVKLPAAPPSTRASGVVSDAIVRAGVSSSSTVTEREPVTDAYSGAGASSPA